jgi:hypothetical protein
MPQVLRPVDLDFFEKAPYRYVSSEVIHRPAQAIFEAIAEDPAGWGAWFPGFSGQGRYLSPPPHGVGSRREVSTAGIRFSETILAWEAPHRWAFQVTRTGLPLARALAEDYQISPHGPYSLVQWTFAIDPRPGFEHLMPIARLVLPRLFRRAMTNLSAHLSG